MVPHYRWTGEEKESVFADISSFSFPLFSSVFPPPFSEEDASSFSQDLIKIKVMLHSAGLLIVNEKKLCKHKIDEFLETQDQAIVFAFPILCYNCLTLTIGYWFLSILTSIKAFTYHSVHLQSADRFFTNCYYLMAGFFRKPFFWFLFYFMRFLLADLGS